MIVTKQQVHEKRRDGWTDEMRTLLARASVVSEVGAATLDKTGGHQKPSAMAPPGSGKSLADRIAERFDEVRTPNERARAVAWAKGELARALRRPRNDLTADQELYWKLQSVQGSGGMDYRRAAERAGLSEKQVWTLRKNAGLNPRTGEPLAA